MPLPWRAVDARRGICGSNNVPARTHISGAVVLGLLRAPVTKMALLPMATSTRPDGMQTALGNCPRIFATSRVSEDWCAKRDRVTPSNKFNIQSTFNQHSRTTRFEIPVPWPKLPSCTLCKMRRTEPSRLSRTFRHLDGAVRASRVAARFPLFASTSQRVSLPPEALFSPPLCRPL